MAFGGAGPLHAARLRRELDISRILVPRNPGILCAMGLLLTDLRADFAATRLMPSTEACRGRRRGDRLAALREQAEHWFEHEGIAAGRPAARRTVDMRYARAELRAEVPCPTARSRGDTLDALATASPRRISAVLRLRRRGRAGADRHLARRGDRHACARPSFEPRRRRRPGCVRRDRRPRDGLAAGGRRLRRLPDLSPRRWTRATASPVRPSSSRWTRRPSSCRAWRRAVDPIST